MSGRRTKTIAAGGALIVGLFGFYFASPYLFSKGTSTELTPDEVRQYYLEHTTTSVLAVSGSTTTGPASGTSVGTAAPTTDAPPPLAVLPKLGIYTYATTGGDEVDALAGQHHDYPATTTITVVPSGCGVLQRWDVLKERWEEWQRCVQGDAIVQPARTNYDSFFGLSQTDAYSCSGDGRPVRAPAGTHWMLVCEEPGKVNTYSGEVIGAETMQVGGTAVDTLHVRITVDNGKSGDSQVTDTWYQVGSDLLIAQTALNATSNPSPVGTTHYLEHYEIHLVSLEPDT